MSPSWIPANSHHKRTPPVKIEPATPYMFSKHRLNVNVVWCDCFNVKANSIYELDACDVPIGLQLIMTTQKINRWTPHRAECNFAYDKVWVSQLLVLHGILHRRRRNLRPNSTTRSPGLHSRYKSSSPYRSARIPLSPWRCTRRTRLRSSQLRSAQCASPNSWRRHSCHTQNVAQCEIQQRSTDIVNARFLDTTVAKYVFVTRNSGVGSCREGGFRCICCKARQRCGRLREGHVASAECRSNALNVKCSPKALK